MALLNICSGNKDDAFYRYKMPKMETKTEGCGNGIKTKVENMADIAKALTRHASYITKYMGCELGALSKFHEERGTAVVNGKHDSSKLAAVLETFIKKFVQCYECGNPETEIFITRSKMINLNCIACGFMSEIDMREKLTNFILKEAKKGSKDEGKKMKKKKKGSKDEGKKMKKKNGKRNCEEVSLSSKKLDEDDDGEVQWQIDTSA